jgi:hypothetical protein
MKGRGERRERVRSATDMFLVSFMPCAWWLNKNRHAQMNFPHPAKSNSRERVLYEI